MTQFHLLLYMFLFIDLRVESVNEVTLKFSSPSPGADVNVTCRFNLAIKSRFFYLLLNQEIGDWTEVAYAEEIPSGYSVQWREGYLQRSPWPADNLALGGSWRNRNLVMTIKNWACGGESYRFYCELIYDVPRDRMYNIESSKRRLVSNCTGTSENGK